LLLNLDDGQKAVLSFARATYAELLETEGVFPARIGSSHWVHSSTGEFSAAPTETYSKRRRLIYDKLPRKTERCWQCRRAQRKLLKEKKKLLAARAKAVALPHASPSSGFRPAVRSLASTVCTIISRRVE